MKTTKKLLLFAGAIGLLLGPIAGFAAERAPVERAPGQPASLQTLIIHQGAPKAMSSAKRWRAERHAQACLPNGFCWAPGLPSCCSGTCTATPKCPGVQECLCE